MKKKILYCFLFFTVCIVLVGCNQKNKKYESSEISLYDKELKNTFELTDEQEEDMLKLWNKSQWKHGLTLTACNYEFVLEDGTVISYLSIFPGMFIDLEGERYMKLTKDQTNYVNSIIKEQAKIQIETAGAELNQELTKEKVTLSEQQMQGILNTWNTSEWEVVEHWPEYDYWFALESKEFVGYDSQNGIFQYGGRRLTVSDEKRQQINALIEQHFL